MQRDFDDSDFFFSLYGKNELFNLSLQIQKIDVIFSKLLLSLNEKCFGKFV